MNELSEQIQQLLPQEKQFLHQIYIKTIEDYSYLWEEFEDLNRLRKILLLIVKLFIEEHSALHDVTNLDQEKFKNAFKELISNADSLLQRTKRSQIKEIEGFSPEEWFKRFWRDITTINQIVEKYEKLHTDWFAHIDTATKRLYNPRLRTQESKEVLEVFPKFLESNKELLMLTMGSKRIAVHLHGSNLLGIGLKGVKSDNKSIWAVHPSDIDTIIFIERHDEYEVRFRSHFDIESKKAKRGWTEEKVDEERIFFFRENSKSDEILGRSLDSFLVNFSELVKEVYRICDKIAKNLSYDANTDFFPIYYTMMLFGSNAIYETVRGIDAKFRNVVIRILTDAEGGQVFWQRVAYLFNTYLVNYQEYAIHPKAVKGHIERTDMAIREILSERNINFAHEERIKKYLKRQRSNLQLPDFKQLQAIRKKMV